MCRKWSRSAPSPDLPLRLLAFDTSGPAISAGGRSTAHRPVVHARHEPLIAATPSASCRCWASVLAEAGWSWGDIDLVAVALGPGDFTGLARGDRGGARAGLAWVSGDGVGTLEVAGRPPGVPPNKLPIRCRAMRAANEVVCAALRGQISSRLTPPGLVAARGREPRLGSAARLLAVVRRSWRAHLPARRVRDCDGARCLHSGRVPPGSQGWQAEPGVRRSSRSISRAAGRADRVPAIRWWRAALTWRLQPKPQAVSVRTVGPFDSAACPACTGAASRRPGAGRTSRICWRMPGGFRADRRACTRAAWPLRRDARRRVLALPGGARRERAAVDRRGPGYRRRGVAGYLLRASMERAARSARARCSSRSPSTRRPPSNSTSTTASSASAPAGLLSASERRAAAAYTMRCDLGRRRRLESAGPAA